MRTKNLFRAIAATCLAAMISVSANAQLTTSAALPADYVVRNTNTDAPTATAPEAVDFVTVGSIMPYNITPDADVAAMVADAPATFLPSVYNWRISGLGTMQQIGGAALTPAVPADPGYYNENEIQVTWGGTAGVATLTVSERSRNTIGLAQCDGSDSTLNIWVMPRPTVDWSETSFTGPQGTAGDNTVGGCAIAVAGAVTPWDIYVDLSYAQDVKIAYTVTKYTMAGVAGAPTTQTLVTSGNYGTAAFYTASPASPNTEIVVLTTLNVPDPEVDRAGAYGRWVYQITAVNDMISRKSGVASQAADIPAGTFTVWSLPTPTTGTIKHVRNTGW